MPFYVALHCIRSLLLLYRFFFDNDSRTPEKHEEKNQRMPIVGSGRTDERTYM